MAKRNDFNFKKVLRRITHDRTFPRRLGTIAVNHFKMSFRNSGFTDRGLVKWKRRKNNADSGRATLVKTGDLRRSIKIKSSSFRKTVIATTGIPYAARHNEGLKGMPQRQFMGDSDKLEEKLKKSIILHIKKAFK